jgi:hypothetical protein
MVKAVEKGPDNWKGSKGKVDRDRWEQKSDDRSQRLIQTALMSK